MGAPAAGQLARRDWEERNRQPAPPGYLRGYLRTRLLGAIDCCPAPELLVPRQYPLQGPVAIGCLEQEKALTSPAIGAATDGCRARWPMLPGSGRDSVDGTVSSAAGGACA